MDLNGGNLMNKDPFKEYIKQSEPNKRDKGYAWHTAIGLQAVDGLKTSKYLIDTAIKNIEGDISIDEAQELLNTYYEENPKADTEDRTEEADKVAVRIAKIFPFLQLCLQVLLQDEFLNLFISSLALSRSDIHLIHIQLHIHMMFCLMKFGQ